MTEQLDRAAALLNLVKATTEHGTAYTNIASMASLELAELEKSAAKEVVERKKRNDERERREIEERQRKLDAQRADAAEKSRGQGGAPDSPIMENRITQTPSIATSATPNVADKPLPPPDPRRQPHGGDPSPYGSANWPDRSQDDRGMPTNPNQPRPVMPGEPVKPQPETPPPVERRVE